MTVLVVHPGVRWSISDVEAGVVSGLEAQGVSVVRYRLDARVQRAKSWLYGSWYAHPDREAVSRPRTADVLVQAGLGVLEQALRHRVDAVVVISAVILHPDVLVLLRRAGLKVYVVLTESPYDHDNECRVASLADGVWTHERSVVPSFRTLTPNAWYLPHAWHPTRHRADVDDDDLPRHDVVFVGSGFSERVAFFNAIDWTGIDLGLYGSWQDLGLKSEVEASVRASQIDNRRAAALYRRARVGLNLYRRTPIRAESLNPRAYELAACGAFQISEYRAESTALFGESIPMFTTPAEAEALIRQWLAAPAASRAALTDQARTAVAGSSWEVRGAQMVRDMEAAVARVSEHELTSESDARLFSWPDEGAWPKSSVPPEFFRDIFWYQPEEAVIP